MKKLFFCVFVLITGSFLPTFCWGFDIEAWKFRYWDIFGVGVRLLIEIAGLVIT
jgi:hypothetical protein